jgi:dCMP deaminase
MNRLTKTQYYLEIAKAVSLRSTCLISHYGSVIVNQDRIISTGYNGSARGADNCCDLGICAREESLDRPLRYDSCKSVHSEASAIIFANYSDLIGSVIYISRGLKTERSHEVVAPCKNCWRLIINAQVSKVVCLQPDDTIIEFNPNDWINKI